MDTWYEIMICFMNSYMRVLTQTDQEHFFLQSAYKLTKLSHGPGVTKLIHRLVYVIMVCGFCFKQLVENGFFMV
jgi:hypothetical protein